MSVKARARLAELIVLGTGFAPKEVVVKKLLGDAIARKIGPVWGLGADGEMTGKYVLGVILLVLGIAILTGLDKQFEAWVLAVVPQWLTDLTIKY